MTDNHIRISRRLSMPVLALAWFTVFAVPVLLLQLSLDYLFELTLKANRQAAASTLIGEMGSFRRDFSATAFVDRSLRNFFSGDTGANADPKELMQQISARFNLRVAGVITHTADTRELNFAIDDLLAQEMQTIPRTLMRRYLLTLNRQHLYDYYSGEARREVDNIYRYADFNKARKDADNFFRRQFGLIAAMPLPPDHVTRTVSSKLGGSAFFYYHPYFSTENGKTRIKGGCLLMIRGSDLNWQNICRETVFAVADRQVERSFSRLKTRLDEKNLQTREIITGFKTDAHGLHLLSTMADNAVIDLIQGGSFTPIHLDRVLTSLPLLRVSIPLRDLQHPLANRAGLINMLSRLFALAGAVFLLRVFFFGIDFRIGISAKVLLGTVVLLLLPVALLLAGFATWNQFNRVYAWYQAEELQRQFYNELQESFGNYLAGLQRLSLGIASEIMAVRLKDESTITAVAAAGLARTTASDLYLDLYSGEKIYLKSPRYHFPSPQEEESSRRLIAGATLHGFDKDGNFAETYSGSRQRNAGSIDSAFVNEMINRWGRPFKLLRLNSGNRFSAIFLHNRDKYSPYGILTLKYFDRTMVREFILKHFKPSARFSKLSARFFLAEQDVSGARLTALNDGKTLQNISLLEKISLAEEADALVWREGGGNLLQARWLNDFPLVILVDSRVFAGDLPVHHVSALLLSYGLLLLLFVFVMFEFIYLRPVREFIRVTEAVSREQYQEQVQLTANDEFGDLKTVFDGMIHGLEQRRKLSHFVSQDVLTAVESGEEAMAPGGVRVAATVVFIQIVSGNEIASDSVDAEFAALGRFISAGDRIANACGGVIDKVIENTLMLVFRAVTAGDNHYLQGCRAALQLTTAMQTEGYLVKAGIASGNVVSGRIGSRLGKLDYTVIGDTVNLAARLKTEADKAATTGIIVAPSTIRGLRGMARVGYIERTEIKGKSREYPLYELLELR